MRLSLVFVILLYDVRAHVRSHDNNGVFKIGCSAFIVGEPAFVEDLKQDIKNIGVGLLNFIE